MKNNDGNLCQIIKGGFIPFVRNIRSTGYHPKTLTLTADIKVIYFQVHVLKAELWAIGLSGRLLLKLTDTGMHDI